MVAWLLPLLCLLLALVLLFLGLRLTGRFQWFVAWARGMGVLLLVGASLCVGIFGYDLLSYRQGSYEQRIGNLSFEQTGTQSFDAVWVDEQGVESRFELSGDQWQLDARILKWSNGIPAQPLYRMDRIGGRYMSLEDERNQPRTVHSLAPESFYIDAWEAVRANGLLFPFIDAVYGTATYLPMADGAIYSISLGHHGLIGRPLNEAATLAMSDW